MTPKLVHHVPGAERQYELGPYLALIYPSVDGFGWEITEATKAGNYVAIGWSKGEWRYALEAVCDEVNRRLADQRFSAPGAAP